MMPLDLFGSPMVVIAVVTRFAFMIGYYGLPFVMSLYFQQLRGLSALATGIAFLPMMLTGAVLTPFTARLAERFGARILVSRTGFLRGLRVSLLIAAAVALAAAAVSLRISTPRIEQQGGGTGV